MKARTTVVAVALAAILASAAEAWAQSPIEVPAVPANLAVPEGQEVFLAGYAIGTQNYMCLLTKKGYGWVFLGPQATLFETAGGAITDQITTHFLSANPVEGGTARPTWQDSSDSSRVWARARASSSDANFVRAGAIPWLLLERAGAATGPTGGNTLAQTTFIHRLNTSGGIAPSTGCGTAEDIGTVALVPYTTAYYFYRATQ